MQRHHNAWDAGRNRSKRYRSTSTAVFSDYNQRDDHDNRDDFNDGDNTGHRWAAAKQHGWRKHREWARVRDSDCGAALLAGQRSTPASGDGWNTNAVANTPADVTGSNC